MLCCCAIVLLLKVVIVAATPSTILAPIPSVIHLSARGILAFSMTRLAERRPGRHDGHVVTMSGLYRKVWWQRCLDAGYYDAISLVIDTGIGERLARESDACGCGARSLVGRRCQGYGSTQQGRVQYSNTEVHRQSTQPALGTLKCSALARPNASIRSRASAPGLGSELAALAERDSLAPASFRCISHGSMLK